MNPECFWTQGQFLACGVRTSKFTWMTALPVSPKGLPIIVECVTRLEACYVSDCVTGGSLFTKRPSSCVFLCNGITWFMCSLNFFCLRVDGHPPFLSMMASSRDLSVAALPFQRFFFPAPRTVHWVPLFLAYQKVNFFIRTPQVTTHTKCFATPSPSAHRNFFLRFLFLPSPRFVPLSNPDLYAFARPAFGQQPAAASHSLLIRYFFSSP